MGMQSPMMQAMHALMGWLHAMGVWPPMMQM